MEVYGVHLDSKRHIKVKTNQVSKGKFHVILSPKISGLYEVHIFLRKKEISTSPIYIRYDFLPKPEAVTIKDVLEECYWQEVCTFIVDATQAGNAELRVNVTSPAKGKEGKLTVTDNQDGTHTVQHVSEAIGSHVFDLTWDGKPVPDSPVKVIVKKRVPVVKHCLGPYINLVHVGELVYLRVVNVGKNESTAFLEAEVSAPDNEDKATIEKQEDGNYSIKFVPTEPKDYSMTVKFHGVPIKDSPLYIKAVEPASLELDFTLPSGIRHSDVEVGHPVCLLIPRDESLSPNTIIVEIIGPFGPCETSICDLVGSTYGLNFTPVFSGEYLVHVKSSRGTENEIKNSPFKIVAVKKESAAQMVFIPEESMTVFADPIPLGTTVSFEIDTKHAGYGTLSVQPQVVGQAEIKLYDQGSGMYRCEVTPREEGRCQLDILWKDESIHDSPFTFLFCEVKGVNLEREKFQTGLLHKFRVEHNQVLGGQLDVTCSESAAAEIQIIPLVDQKAYECILTPSRVGDHQVSVMYNGFHIEGSPFNVKFHYPPSTAMSFSVNAEGAETSDVSATIQSSLNLEELPSQLSQLFGGQYSLEFIPTQGLEYLVTIKYHLKMIAKEKEVLGSPFTLSYIKQPVDASKCVVKFDEDGGASGVVSGIQSSFFILSEGAGHGQLKVTINGPDIKPKVSVKSVSTTKTEVKYVLHRSGRYHIAITWDGEPIPGSPFKVQCTAPEGMVSLFGRPDFPMEIQHGEPLTFSLRPKTEEESGELVMITRSKMYGIIPGTVEHKDGTYQCTVDLKYPGRYVVEVTWNGKLVEGTPFEVRVVQTPNPEKVTVEGPGLEGGYVGQQGNFIINTTDAGTGTLSLNVEGPKGGFKVNLTRHPEKDHTIFADYNPEHAGKYVINILWSGVNVPGSPFNVNIKEKTE